MRLHPGIALALLLLAAPHADAASLAFSAKRAIVALACREFSDYDHNGDGTVEINALQLQGISKPADEALADRDTVLVVVEPRLLATGDADELADLQPALRMHAADLAAEGYDAFVVSAQVYAGPRHQDGRTVLALRAFLRGIWRDLPDLRGVVFVGNFPEAALVRQYYWTKNTPITLNEGKPGERKFEEKVEYIRDKAELVAWRAEIVLADMDGQWDGVYHEAERQVPYFIAAYPDGVQASDSVSDAYEFGTDSFQDFFLIDDGKWTMEAMGKGKIRFSLLDDENDECAPDDLAQPNPMARPEISVSRINAYHAGVEPKASLPGASVPLLDEDGVPQVVEFAEADQAPRGVGVWEHSDATERQLLIEYFDRNHRYRQGEFADARRPSCISTEFGTSIPHARKTFREWRDFDDPNHDINGLEDASLVECVRWLQRPALLRFLKAHSDPWGSTFAKSDETELLNALGGQAWVWKRDEGKLVPGIASCGKLDFAIHRTLWQNDMLPDCAVIYYHIGCESTAPEGASTRPYSDPKYGYWQGAESLMFYCNGLTLLGRSKVFYDSPRGFCETLADGGTCGEAWAEYFEIESLAEDVSEVGGGIGRKRAYFWSLMGDWTIGM
ncbi:MAG TPA: hypothetical protein QGH10_01600 [Armatimonadota bacterium]|nr:hypothetical protein [Armatimonadota bacterium]